MGPNELKKEVEKYKALYENEKDHSDTLMRIINILLNNPPKSSKDEEKANKHNDWFGDPPYDFTCKNIIDYLYR